MDLLRGLFSGDPTDMSRIAVWGLVVMLIGIVDVIAAGRLARQFAGGEREETVKMALKLGGLALVIIGALGAMKVIG